MTNGNILKIFEWSFELEKKKVEIVFIVLTYRNTEDLEVFVRSTKKKIKENYKIVVVNSFYDIETNKLMKQIAEEGMCDFIEVENKGYGYGNNRGVEFAIKQYDFNFIIISNPDIEIQDFDYNLIRKNKSAIFAPNIKTLNGKSQNPYYPYNIKLIHDLKYKGYFNNQKPYIFGAIILNKILRQFFLIKNKFSKSELKQVYATHGSFLIVGNEVFQKMYPLYLEEMFLFSEEVYLAYKAKKNGVKSFYVPKLKILHKEDGSINISNIDVSSNAKESYLILSKFIAEDIHTENK